MTSPLATPWDIEPVKISGCIPEEDDELQFVTESKSVTIARMGVEIANRQFHCTVEIRRRHTQQPSSPQVN